MKLFIALIGATVALKVNKMPVYAGMYHWNEDPHSVPTPLSGTPYLTSTQARFISENSTANMESREPQGPLPWHFKVWDFNKWDKEYSTKTHWSRRQQLVQLQDEIEDDTLVLTNAESGSTWRVIPDYGEKDFNVVEGERDIDNGKKFSGWNNPLAWTDDGSDDDRVV